MRVSPSVVSRIGPSKTSTTSSIASLRSTGLSLIDLVVVITVSRTTVINVRTNSSKLSLETTSSSASHRLLKRRDASTCETSTKTPLGVEELAEATGGLPGLACLFGCGAARPRLLKLSIANASWTGSLGASLGGSSSAAGVPSSRGTTGGPAPGGIALFAFSKKARNSDSQMTPSPSESNCSKTSSLDHLFTHWESRTKQAAARRRWSNSAVACFCARSLSLAVRVSILATLASMRPTRIS
mmetsp:Transcript_2662/g.6885  ORF Transcript_2662/g.6885 Transcript_2662/m.6885 type:complete len:242 (-) Transcript_2662:2100-2825(-)